MNALSPEKALIFLHHARYERSVDSREWVASVAMGPLADPKYVQIGNPDLIARWPPRDVPVALGGTLGDYIPFYFTPSLTHASSNIKTGYNAA